MLDAMLGSCNVVMAKQCNATVNACHAAAAPSETEREMEQPLLQNSGNRNAHVEELACNAVDSERCTAPRGTGGCEFEALATAPVELTTELPATYKPGTAILMHGPHGPVRVVPPQNAEPGTTLRWRLAPTPEFRIQVPSNNGPGSIIHFERSDGVEVAVGVPAHLQAGDIFEVTPPSMMVRAPEGAHPGDRVVFRHSLGEGPGGREATEWCRAEIPKGVRPGDYFAARLPKPEQQPPSNKEAQLSCPRGDVMGIGGSCTAVRSYLPEDMEDI